jgi:hypothetical protein
MTVGQIINTTLLTLDSTPLPNRDIVFSDALRRDA